MTVAFGRTVVSAARKRVVTLCTPGAALLLAGCAATASDNVPQEKPVTTCPQTRNWAAWINAMPGPGDGPTLIVVGEVELPAGTVARLERGPTDRMMPPGQRFTLHLEASVETGAETGAKAGGGAGGWQPVRAEIVPAQMQYRSVMIGCNEQAIAEITDVKVAY